jgi:hypothetical protein
MHRLVARITPFLFLGMGLVALIAGLILFSYLLILGALVGLALFVITWVKEKFFPSKSLSTRERPELKRKGRTFDHEK